MRIAKRNKKTLTTLFHEKEGMIFFILKSLIAKQRRTAETNILSRRTSPITGTLIKKSCSKLSSQSLAKNKQSV